MSTVWNFIKRWGKRIIAIVLLVLVASWGYRFYKKSSLAAPEVTPPPSREVVGQPATPREIELEKRLKELEQKLAQAVPPSAPAPQATPAPVASQPVPPRARLVSSQNVRQPNGTMATKKVYRLDLAKSRVRVVDVFNNTSQVQPFLKKWQSAAKARLKPMLERGEDISNELEAIRQEINNEAASLFSSHNPGLPRAQGILEVSVPPGG